MRRGALFSRLRTANRELRTAPIILPAMLAMAILSHGGCARARSTLAPSTPKTQEPGPVEIMPLEPIRASINQGKVPADLDTVRASLDIEDPPADATPAMPALVEAPPSVANEPPADDPPTTQPPAANPPAAAPQPAKPETPGADAIPLRTGPSIDPGKRVTLTAAIVGNTVITFRELEIAVCQKLKCKPHELREMAREQPRQANMMVKDTLEGLIDRTLILQEFRKGKKPQQWTMFSEYVERVWREKEIPAMCRRAGVEDEFLLAKKLEEQGESLDDLKNAYKEETMSREILMMQVQPRVEKPGLPEMQRYYYKHRDDPANHRDAQVRWHEILISVSKPAELAAARKMAAAVRQRLLAGEDFATLARSASAGATAAKGGEWETSPDGYPVPAVNKALATLAPGQISPPIESDKGIHIVRVDSRRTAGPATFVELQKDIAKAIFEERFSRQVEGYLKKLRAQTTISSPLFAGSSTAPDALKHGIKTDPAAQRTSGR